ncbi:MAG: hypothetical protein J7619_23025 [Dyadobacter sp.]|uniref:hypothetical protein n=1 Tax=Dyadobacter sp. TaxID=1914288 RepID=UPI001B04536B|nr:hypothetical protein [Dyadobacter sp.]MBO9615588.1 hypothetical protein [Dyadobacter sp.]
MNQLAVFAGLFLLGFLASGVDRIYDLIAAKCNWTAVLIIGIALLITRAVRKSNQTPK